MLTKKLKAKLLEQCELRGFAQCEDSLNYINAVAQFDKSLLVDRLEGRVKYDPYTGKDYDLRYGLCYFIEHHLPELYLDYFQDTVFKLWPKSSGSASYPIPATDTYTTTGIFLNPASRQYQCFPRWEGEQRALRLELFEFLVDCARFYLSYLEGSKND